MLASILVHEAAHAVLAQRYGVEVSSITLWFLGGVAHLEDEAPNAKAEAQIAGAGPASSLDIASMFLGLGWIVAISEISPLLSATLFWIGGLNAVLGIFNLLPGAPLDGGRYWDRPDAPLAVRDLCRVKASDVHIAHPSDPHDRGKVPGQRTLLASHCFAPVRSAFHCHVDAMWSWS